MATEGGADALPSKGRQIRQSTTHKPKQEPKQREPDMTLTVRWTGEEAGEDEDVAVCGKDTVLEVSEAVAAQHGMEGRGRSIGLTFGGEELRDLSLTMEVPDPDPDPDPNPYPNPYPNASPEPNPNPNPDPHPTLTLTRMLALTLSPPSTLTAGTGHRGRCNSAR